MLTERQKKAEVLARELKEMGAAVTNPMPLADDANLRFRILATLADPILEALKEGDWNAHFITSGPEFRLDGTTPLANTYEVDIPTPRTAVPDGRIAGEIGREKPSAEVEAMLKAVGMLK